MVIRPDGGLIPVGLHPVLQVIFTTLLVAVLILAGGFALLTLYKLFSGQE